MPSRFVACNIKRQQSPQRMDWLKQKVQQLIYEKFGTQDIFARSNNPRGSSYTMAQS